MLAGPTTGSSGKGSRCTMTQRSPCTLALTNWYRQQPRLTPGLQIARGRPPEARAPKKELRQQERRKGETCRVNCLRSRSRQQVHEGENEGRTTSLSAEEPIPQLPHGKPLPCDSCSTAAAPYCRNRQSHALPLAGPTREALLRERHWTTTTAAIYKASAIEGTHPHSFVSSWARFPLGYTLGFITLARTMKADQQVPLSRCLAKVNDGRVSRPRKDRDLNQEEMHSLLAKLKELVPNMPRNKRLSKLEIIQNVIDYILDLQLALEAHPASRPSHPTGSSSSPARQPLGVLSPSANAVANTCGVQEVTNGDKIPSHLTDLIAAVVQQPSRPVSC